MSEHANPETGADEESVVDSLLAPEEDKPEEEETEAAQGPQDDGESEPEVDEADAEPEEAEDEQPDTSARYTVKANGKELQVTLDELLRGYSREADYRHKTQELAEERRAAKAERERQEQITAQLIEAYQKAGAGDETEPDWQKLADDLDPWEFQKRRAAWDTQQRAKAEARRQAEELQKERLQAYAREQAEMLKQKVPEWSTREAFAPALQKMAEAATEYDFQPQEVINTLDHRMLIVLRDALEYRKLQKAKPAVEKKIAKAPKVVKPGTPQSKADRAKADQDALRKKLKRTGSVDDAVAYLLGGEA